MGTSFSAPPVSLTIPMRYHRFKIIILAVFMAEIVKLITCIGLVVIEEGTFLRFKASLHNAIIKNKMDTVSSHDSLLRLQLIKIYFS